jgi:hypothetical protein
MVFGDSFLSNQHSANEIMKKKKRRRRRMSEVTIIVYESFAFAVKYVAYSNSVYDLANLNKYYIIV